MEHKFCKYIMLGMIVCCAASCDGDNDRDAGKEREKEIVKEIPWQILFDGSSTKGWHTFNKDTLGSAWQIQDSTLHLDATKKNGWQTADGGDIIYEKEFTDFDLKLEWKISEGGNSGIMFYAQEGPQYDYPWQTGIECQVADNEKNEDGKVYKSRAGDLYELVPCNREVIKPAGQWNQVEIASNKGNLSVLINGMQVIYTTIWDDKWKQIIAGTKFKDMPGFGMFKKGKIALQDHGADVWYKNIMIKEL